MDYFKDGTYVIIHSLGNTAPGEFKAIVRGITQQSPDGCTYILELIDQFDPNNKYSCVTVVSSCVKENSAMNRARERGICYMDNFNILSKEEKIEIIAKLIYRIICLDPFGYPNGQPDWDDLPDVDSNFEVGVDKYRFVDSAEQVYRIINWKSTSLIYFDIYMIGSLIQNIIKS